jgi:hypothetical protein
LKLGWAKEEVEVTTMIKGKEKGWEEEGKKEAEAGVSINNHADIN